MSETIQEVTGKTAGEYFVRLDALVANPTITGETTIDLDAAGGATNDVKFIWNAAADLPAGFKAQNVNVKVAVEK